MNAIELIPCECGSVPQIIRVGDHKEYYISKCPNCHLILAPNNRASVTISGAVSEWNKRR